MKDRPKPEKSEEIRELIRVKVDLYGLTKEDIDYLIAHGLARKPREGVESDRRSKK